MNRIGVNVEGLAIELPDLVQSLHSLAREAPDRRRFVEAARQCVQSFAAQSGQPVQVSFRAEGVDYCLSARPDGAADDAGAGLPVLLRLAREHEDDEGFRSAVCRHLETRGVFIAPSEVDRLIQSVGSRHGSREELASACFELGRMEGSARGTLNNIPLCRAVADRLAAIAFPTERPPERPAVRQPAPEPTTPQPSSDLRADLRAELRDLPPEASLILLPLLVGLTAGLGKD